MCETGRQSLVATGKETRKRSHADLRFNTTCNAVLTHLRIVGIAMNSDQLSMAEVERILDDLHAWLCEQEDRVRLSFVISEVLRWWNRQLTCFFPVRSSAWPHPIVPHYPSVRAPLAGLSRPRFLPLTPDRRVSRLYRLSS